VSGKAAYYWDMHQIERYRAELAKLRWSTESSEFPSGLFGVEFVAVCPIDPCVVLERIRDILETVDNAALADWPMLEQWRKLLPQWFLDASPNEPTGNEARNYLERWRTMSDEDQAVEDCNRPWPLAAWLYWLTRENRQCFFGDAKSEPEIRQIAMVVLVEGWPVPWGALRWLFKAAGASTIYPAIGTASR